MKRVLEYKIVSDDCPDIMQKAVNDCLRQGWRLLGGISCALSESDEYYYALYAQSLVRYNDIPEKIVILETTENSKNIQAPID
jgi:hypothetical protein